MNAGARISGIALLDALERGEVRCAERGVDGAWRVNAWVKEEILAVFRSSQVVPMGLESPPSGAYLDKEPLAPRRFEPAQGVRIVPGGSAVRRGAFLARGVVVMPPAYVNIGAWIGEGTMVDSHALVGSCAQIGGVLEPANARPVVVEDDCFVGGNCGVYEGVLLRQGAVLASGVVLASGTVVHDCVRGVELRGTREAPLEIPEGAVVVPGTRPLRPDDPVARAGAEARGLQVACALIVKYRDERTDRATALEQALR